MRVYLDHNATTPTDIRVLEKMQPYFAAVFGNASSVHSFGKDAVRGVDEAKTALCTLFGCKHKEVIFTSGATESNALALRGVIGSFRKENPSGSLHMVTSMIEHPSVLETAKFLEREGIEVTYVPVSPSGVVVAEDVLAAIQPNTVLVSIMYVNNELGTIQPIRAIGKGIEKINKSRAKQKENTAAYGESKKLSGHEKVYFHTDAVQAAFYEPLRAPYLHVDLISVSGHKIYGPKGVGALYIREGTPIQSILQGGEQEYGLRPGTYNVPAIVGFGAATELLTTEEHERDLKHIAALREYFVAKLSKAIPDVLVHGDPVHSVHGTVHFAIPGIEGETLLLALDLRGIAVSTGSACAAGAIEPSPVLTAVGLSKDTVRGSIRVSLGKNTTKEELAYTITALTEICQKLRKKRKN